MIRSALFFTFFIFGFYSCSQPAGTGNSKSTAAAGTSSLKNGDLIFQTSQSSQCKAVQLATHSIYSHCGIIYVKNNVTFVYEAVQPVKLTPLDEFAERGKDGKYVVKRLKNAEAILTPAVLAKMQSEGEKYEGKNYDLFFEWSDDRIYCSELLWKIYKQGAGIEIGKLEKLKDFDLGSEPVKVKLKERYGDHILFDETVISPASIFESEKLYTVYEN